MENGPGRGALPQAFLPSPLPRPGLGASSPRWNPTAPRPSSRTFAGTHELPCPLTSSLLRVSGGRWCGSNLTRAIPDPEATACPRRFASPYFARLYPPGARAHFLPERRAPQCPPRRTPQVPAGSCRLRSFLPAAGKRARAAVTCRLCYHTGGGPHRARARGAASLTSPRRCCRPGDHAWRPAVQAARLCS